MDSQDEIKQKVSVDGYAVSEGIVTSEGRRLALGFYLDEYSYDDVDEIKKHMDIFDCPDDGDVWGSSGVWVKQAVQGIISLDKLKQIVDVTTCFELYDLDKKQAIAGRNGNESRIYDENGEMEEEEIPE